MARVSPDIPDDFALADGLPACVFKLKVRQPGRSIQYDSRLCTLMHVDFQNATISYANTKPEKRAMLGDYSVATSIMLAIVAHTESREIYLVDQGECRIDLFTNGKPVSKVPDFYDLGQWGYNDDG